MPSPRVTVIIATYNRSSVLSCAIASVLDQTMRDFELLVIGDGCTDDSEAVVAAVDDPRVRWINLPANTGHQSGPNNRGLAEAKGEYVAYLGHDDLWLPHHLACAVATLDLTGAAMAHSLLALILPGRDGPTPSLPFPEVGSWGPPSCTVHRRSVTEQIGGWRNYRNLDTAPEIDLWRRARAAGYEFAFVPRLTAIKFPASVRPGVYQTRGSDEQTAWLQRIRLEPDLEQVELVHMIVGGEGARALRIRTLLRLLGENVPARLIGLVSRRSGRTAIFWKSKGAGIAAVRKYKGL